MATQLKNAAGEFVTIQAGESANLTGTLKDASQTTLASVSTFTITLFDQATSACLLYTSDAADE